MAKVFYYPSARREYANPYSANYKKALSKHYVVLDDFTRNFGATICLLCHTFVADIFIFNWIESISSHKFGGIQYQIVRLCFEIIRLRKKEIVWMLHNIHPHSGSDRRSEAIMSYLFKHANVIISHSLEATEMAKGRAKGKVEYICHPVTPLKVTEPWRGQVTPCDVLIWGDILPYKGVIEFLEEEKVKALCLKIHIVGKCTDTLLLDRLSALCTSGINYENSRASFSELQVLIHNARYVLFPYLSGSVSSSGSLIDTVMMGGTPVGPNIGAFKDLSQEGVCLVYNNTEELVEILTSNKTTEEDKRQQFISQNSWDAFAERLHEMV